jgi:hypothetical protein
MPQPVVKENYLVVYPRLARRITGMLRPERLLCSIASLLLPAQDSFEQIPFLPGLIVSLLSFSFIISLHFSRNDDQPTAIRDTGTPLNIQHSILRLLHFANHFLNNSLIRPAQRWHAHIHHRVYRLCFSNTFTCIWGALLLVEGSMSFYPFSSVLTPSCSPPLSSESRPRPSRRLPRCPPHLSTPRLPLFFVPCSLSSLSRTTTFIS